MLFAVHGHHFQQQAAQATTQPFLALRQTTQRLGAGLLLVDQGAGEPGQILTGRANWCGHAGQCVGRIRPVQCVAQRRRNPVQQAMVAFLVLEDESHHQGNDRVTAGLSEMLVLTECLDF